MKIRFFQAYIFGREECRVARAFFWCERVPADTCQGKPNLSLAMTLAIPGPAKITAHASSTGVLPGPER
jgi:hypothetical protein